MYSLTGPRAASQYSLLPGTTEAPSKRKRGFFAALVSPHPWDLEAIRPIFDPDLSKYRFVDAHDVAAGLDAGP